MIYRYPNTTVKLKGKFMKKTFALILFIIILASSSALSAFAVDNTVNTYLNGFYVEYETPARIIDGRTMVPVRTFAEVYGATVDWIADERKVICTRGDTVISMVIDSAELYKNGELFETLDCPPIIVFDNGNYYTLAPIRALADAFDLKLDWIAQSNSALITDISDDTFMIVGAFPIDSRMFEYYYNYVVNYFSANDSDFLNNKANADTVKELVTEEILSYAALLDIAAQSGYSPYNLYESAAIESTFNAYKSYYGNAFDEELEESYMNEKLFKDFLFTSLARDGILSDIDYYYSIITDDEKVNAIMFSKDIIRCVHILTADFESANSIIDKAKNATDEEFFALMEEYSIDTESKSDRSGYYIAPGETIKEYDDASFALNVGETSDIIESENGYYIIRQLAKDEEFVKANLEAFWEYLILGIYNRALSETSEALRLQTVFTQSYAEFDFTSAFANTDNN